MKRSMFVTALAAACTGAWAGSQSIVVKSNDLQETEINGTTAGTADHGAANKSLTNPAGKILYAPGAGYDNEAWYQFSGAALKSELGGSKTITDISLNLFMDEPNGLAGGKIDVYLNAGGNENWQEYPLAGGVAGRDGFNLGIGIAPKVSVNCPGYVDYNNQSTYYGTQTLIATATVAPTVVGKSMGTAGYVALDMQVPSELTQLIESGSTFTLDLRSHDYETLNAKTTEYYNAQQGWVRNTHNIVPGQPDFGGTWDSYLSPYTATGGLASGLQEAPYMQVTAKAVPGPASLLTLGAGLLGLAFKRRRR